TTAREGEGGKPVVTASIPRTERVPVAYICVNCQPSCISSSRFGVRGRPPKEPTNCAPKLSCNKITKFLRL
ncbi:hypothetical protein D046_8554, partial [Vibrio parahaemolyticus V-223/04]